jgi:hypothetical protein
LPIGSQHSAEPDGDLDALLTEKNRDVRECCSDKPFVLSVSKHELRRKRPFDRLRANGFGQAQRQWAAFNLPAQPTDTGTSVMVSLPKMSITFTATV